MKQPARLLVLLGPLLLALPVGCGKDDDSGAAASGGASSSTGGAKDEEGLRMCCELGALCHHVGATGGPVEDCHEMAHENDPVWCRANFDRCHALCEAAEGGAGGNGGEGGASQGTPHSCLL